MSAERNDVWPGLAYVERHGLPGFPPPIVREPAVDPHTAEGRKWAKRTRERAASKARTISLVLEVESC